MAHLTLAGMSGDGKRLLLVDDAGAEFTVDVDQRLRAALRGETSRLGQLEIQMDSVLRPRDIQARIRAGETPEAVAQAAQTSVEKIMPFAGPVLAEREHVADRAQKSSVRRRPGSHADATSAARALGDAVESHLRHQNVDPGTVAWDAWRREDGRWSLVAEFSSIKRSGTAQFTFDMPGNFVMLDNDDARWLVGEILDEPIPAARDELGDARQRRLSTVEPAQDRAAELPLGEDILDLVNEADSHPIEVYATPSDQAGPATSYPSTSPTSPPAPEATPEPTTELPTDIGDMPEADPAAAVAPEESEPGTADAPEVPQRRPAKNRRGRASVPSWDEIMFGGGKPE